MTQSQKKCFNKYSSFAPNKLNPPYLTFFHQPLDMVHEKTKNDVCFSKLEYSLSDISWFGLVCNRGHCEVSTGSSVEAMSIPFTKSLL